MSDTSWWAAWGQSATAITGAVLGAGSLTLGIYNARMGREKHGREKQDRAREEQRDLWVRERVEKLRRCPTALMLRAFWQSRATAMDGPTTPPTWGT